MSDALSVTAFGSTSLTAVTPDEEVELSLSTFGSTALEVVGGAPGPAGRDGRDGTNGSEIEVPNLTLIFENHLI